MATRNIPGSTDRRIDALLTLLSDNSMIVVSGQKISRATGVSRSTVWRWIQKLRALGVRVKGHPRTGYQLERMPDVLLPSHLRRQLIDTPFGKHIHHFFEAGSTNGIAFDMGQAGEPHGTVVLAEEQTGGRGRAGRSWHSEKTSGIYATVLLRPQASPVLAPVITMLAGLAARDAVLEELEVAPDLRWPNDLLLGGKKFCGILTEMHAEPDRIHFVIVGMGINVNHAGMPPELARIATSLRMATGKTHSRLQLLVRLLRHLDSYYNRFLAEGPAPIVARFSEVSSYARGKPVRITTAKETYVGTTDGLEPNGLLRVRRADGRVETVISGDVTEAS
jgi:BirA family transcriptional regulator, biotin operon repressor / biotin---[acetyl-CoA-carboxylase] ligase